MLGLGFAGYVTTAAGSSSEEGRWRRGDGYAAAATARGRGGGGGGGGGVGGGEHGAALERDRLSDAVLALCERIARAPPGSAR